MAHMANYLRETAICIGAILQSIYSYKKETE